MIALAALVGFSGVGLYELSNRTTLPAQSAVLPTPAPATTAPSGTLASCATSAVVDITTTVAGGRAEGTGMILTSSGLVLTNNHVIDGALTVTVTVGGTGASRAATVVGYDATKDVAVLQITGASNLPTVTTGDAGQVSIGAPVTAIGNALGRGGVPVCATGQVTALDRTITASDANGVNPETLYGLIQVNAHIVPGDSGGPLVDGSGKVIGMDTAGTAGAGGGGAASDGFAIPINGALQVVQQITSGQGSSTVQIGPRGILGVSVGDSTTPAGASLAGVEPSSPAAAAGMVAGDVIVAVDGTTVDSAASLGTAMRGHKPNDRVSVEWVDAGGLHHTAKVSLVAGPPA